MVFGAHASADELVKFTSAGRREEPIQGYLTRPKGAGPFPAVVLLALLPRPARRPPLDRRRRSPAGAMWRCSSTTFPTRGLKETCAVDFPEAAPDAFGALAFLVRAPVRRQGADRRGRLLARRRHRAQDRRFGERERSRFQGRSGLLSPMRERSPAPDWRSRPSSSSAPTTT